MPFLFHYEDMFILISHNIRQGIYYQTYTKRGFSRPTFITNYPTSSYTAALDSTGNIHIVCQTSKTSISYFRLKERIVEKKIILEDSKNHFDFNHLSLQFFNEKLYLFYTSLQPDEQKRHLICNMLFEENRIYSLISNLEPSPSLDISAHSQGIRITYLDFDTYYVLRSLHIQDELSKEDLFYSDVPITDFALCDALERTHVVYIQDKFGKSQLCYIHPHASKPMLLTASHSIEKPCIFYYLEALWVSYVHENEVYLMLSLDGGSSFSSPIKASLPEGITQCHFSSTSFPYLKGHLFHAYLNGPIRLVGIHALDVYHLHPDLSPPAEYILYLDELKKQLHTSPPLKTAPKIEPTHSEPSNPPSNLKAATKAFMSEGTHFNDPPRA